MTNNPQAPMPTIQGWVTAGECNALAEHIENLRQFDATSFPPDFAEHFLGLIEKVETVLQRENDLHILHVDTLAGSRLFAFVGPKDVPIEYADAREHLNTLGDPDFGKDQADDAEESGFITALATAKIGVFDGMTLRGGL